eukprot:560608-Rhodomonas_salina.4
MEISLNPTVVESAGEYLEQEQGPPAGPLKGCSHSQSKAAVLPTLPRVELSTGESEAGVLAHICWRNMSVLPTMATGIDVSTG